MAERTYTPSSGADAALATAPRLSMSDAHVELISAGRKRSTLRTATYRGWYTLHRDGSPVLCVNVHPMPIGDQLAVRWTKLTDAQRHELARDEGYADAGEFEQAMLAAEHRWPHLGQFVRGDRPLVYHRIWRVVNLAVGS
jgi:hypothetical protein